MRTQCNNGKGTKARDYFGTGVSTVTATKSCGKREKDRRTFTVIKMSFP